MGDKWINFEFRCGGGCGFKGVGCEVEGKFVVEEGLEV